MIQFRDSPAARSCRDSGRNAAVSQLGRTCLRQFQARSCPSGDPGGRPSGRGSDRGGHGVPPGDRRRL